MGIEIRISGESPLEALSFVAAFGRHCMSNQLVMDAANVILEAEKAKQTAKARTAQTPPPAPADVSAAVSPVGAPTAPTAPPAAPAAAPVPHNAPTYNAPPAGQGSGFVPVAPAPRPTYGAPPTGQAPGFVPVAAPTAPPQSSVSPAVPTAPQNRAADPTMPAFGAYVPANGGQNVNPTTPGTGSNATTTQTSLFNQPPATVPGASVPTSNAPGFTLHQVSKAGADLVTMNPAKQPELTALLQRYGVQTLMELKPEHLGAFAMELRGLGANI